MTVEERIEILEKEVAELKISFQSLAIPAESTLTDALQTQMEEIRTMIVNHETEANSMFNDHQQQIDLKAPYSEVPQIELSGSTLQFISRT